MYAIVGTAGHIDHGKTALVKALTGVDADRLPDEKRRGITVDLGFAEMSVGDVHFGFVDVPGHERFVKNMLAGASGIDLVLFVVAADEGVKPQTREHFDICRLLDLKRGVIALTKTDLIDAETLQLAQMDVAELVAGSFLEMAPVIPVSSRTGSGISDLTTALVNAISHVSTRSPRYVTRLPIDRSFTIKGFGAVVTGTLTSGTLEEGAEVELLPQSKRLRIRGLQTHGRSVAAAGAGQRVAVNLGGIDHSSVVRGMVLAESNSVEPTQAIDAHVEVLDDASRPLRSRQRVRFHAGTAEVLARIQVLDPSGEISLGKDGYIQLRFEEPVVVVSGERFILRSYSPQITIAGGEIVDPLASRHKQREFGTLTAWLASFRGSEDAGKIEILVSRAGARGMSTSEIQRATGFTHLVINSALTDAIDRKVMIDCGGIVVETATFFALRQKLLEAVAAFHRREPLSKGLPLDILRSTALSDVRDEISKAVIRFSGEEKKIVVVGESVRLTSHQTELSPSETRFMDALRETYVSAKLEVPRTSEAVATAIKASGISGAQADKLLRLMLASEEMIKITDELSFSKGAIDDLIARTREYASRGSDRIIDVSVFKDIAGVSRKYAIPLLEYLDAKRITARAGDKRVVL